MNAAHPSLQEKVALPSYTTPSQSFSDLEGEKPLIAICVPTYARLKPLSNCLTQIAKLTRPESCRLCLIVVDNDPQGNAASVFDQVKSSCPFEAYYFREAEHGFANARNRLLQEAIKLRAHYIAFVDDDEFPPQDWLIRHIEALQKYGADVSHGPVIQVRENGLPNVDAQNRLMKKKPTGSKKNHVSSSNAVFDIKLAEPWGLRFDPFFNRVYGEDHDFFDRAKARGAKWIWIREAIVYETLSAERENWRYLFSRHYSGGIHNVLKYAHSHPRAQTWIHFIPKIGGKIISLIPSLFFLNIRKLIKDAATTGGYLVALIRNRNPD